MRKTAAIFSTPDGQVTYRGEAQIDGVPGTAAAVLQNFPEAAGSSCGALLPTGSQVDVVDGVQVTCIDNGMPVVVMRAADVGITGYETREELDANEELKHKLERIRLQLGDAMNLGNVAEKTVPKMTLVAAPRAGGAICTRTFIPHRCHASIGVLGAVSVATACMMPESPAAGLCVLPTTEQSAESNIEKMIRVEHPIGETGVLMQVEGDGAELSVRKAAILRTARKLMSGRVYPA